MESRKLRKLVLNNEDYIFAGNLTIKHSVEITNGNLIVSGNLTIYGKLNIKNGNIIVSGILTIENYINIKGGNISCGTLNCTNINIKDGDIWTNGNLNAYNITSDGNIEVGAYANVYDVNCLNYLISGDNDSCTIKTTQDIYILGDNDSEALTAREILIGSNCDTNGESITAHHFVCGGELSCKGLFVE